MIAEIPPAGDSGDYGDLLPANVSASIRLAAWMSATAERGTLRCGYCGVAPAYGDVVVDHVCPQARGGGHENENLRIACRRCNCVKSAHSLDEFRRLLESRCDREVVFYFEGGRAWPDHVRRRRLWPALGRNGRGA